MNPNLTTDGFTRPALPWSDKWGLVAAIWLRSPSGIAYAVVMVWAANCSAGHTKNTTVIALYHVGYGLGNILSPQLFQPQYKVLPLHFLHPDLSFPY